LLQDCSTLLPLQLPQQQLLLPTQQWQLQQAFSATLLLPLLQLPQQQLLQLEVLQ
jgi:hypothetical protein